MKLLITYATFAIIYETVTLIIGYKSLKKRFSELHPYLKEITKLMAEPMLLFLKQRFWNWYTITFIIIPMYLVVCQYLFPYNLFHHIRRLLFGKSKLEKNIEDIENSRKESADFMRNEGYSDVNNDNIDSIVQPNNTNKNE